MVEESRVIGRCSLMIEKTGSTDALNPDLDSVRGV